MSRRREPQQRASEQLNLALARIHAAIGLLETVGGTSLANLKKQMEEGIEEAYAALGDVRHVASLL